MSKRIFVNLSFFALIGVVLGYWAISNVLNIDLQRPPYEVTADFVESPGLQPGYDVGYLGTPIGRIDSVELADRHVVVTMAIEDGREIPAGSSLAVRRKSAVGEPYVDVIPPDGAEPGGPHLADGDHVPIERTMTPVSYSELFSALDDLVTTIPEEDLGTLLHEFAAAVDGRSGSIRDIITGSDDALETFAEHSDLLEESTASLSRLTRVFADHRTSFAEGLENSELVTESLANARADVEVLLRDGNSLATRTADLLGESGGDLSCVIGGLTTVTEGLDRPEVLAALGDLFASAPDAALVFRDVVAWEDDGPYIRAIPPLNVGGGEDVPVYESPHTLPAVTAVPGCPAMDAAAAPGGSDSVGPGGDSASDGPSPAGDPGPDENADGAQASSDADVDDGGFNPLVIVAILLGIAVVAAIRPWRWIPGRS